MKPQHYVIKRFKHFLKLRLRLMRVAYQRERILDDTSPLCVDQSGRYLQSDVVCTVNLEISVTDTLKVQKVLFC